MLAHGEEFGTRLLDLLQEVEALSEKDNRDALLRGMPVAARAISRSSNQIADLHKIIAAAESWGQLDNGHWPLAILVKNALRLTRGSQVGRDLTALLAEFEPSVEGPAPLPVDEVIVGNKDERLPLRFFELGLVAARSVAKIIVRSYLNGVEVKGSVTGTGWMISPGLLLTNHHVINARLRGQPAASLQDFELQAHSALACFGFDDAGIHPVQYSCTKMVHASQMLDYAVLRLSPDPGPAIGGNSPPLSNWGYLAVPQALPLLQKGDRLNIIQHPLGLPKMFAIRSNYYFGSGADSTRVRYLTDTEPGSSGSPVMNDEWQVLALHHQAVQVPETTYRGEIIKFNNQGILMASILADLPSKVRDEIVTAQAAHNTTSSKP